MKANLMYLLFVVGFPLAVVALTERPGFWVEVLMLIPIWLWANWTANQVYKKKE